MNVQKIFCFGILLSVVVAPAYSQEKVTFDDHIKPLFRQRCASCHNTDKKEGDLDVTNYTNLMQGGGSGEVIAPGDVGGSYLFSLVNHDDEPAMPPDSPRIPDAELSLLSSWIEQGALENKSSKAKMREGPKVATLDASPQERPSVVVVPAHLSLEPINVTARANTITAMHTSPWAPLIAVAGPGQIHLYSTDTREIRGVLPFPEGSVNVLRFSRNGSLLMGAGGRPGAQGIVAIWDLRSGERLLTLDQEVDSILAADLSPDQQMVVVGGAQKMVRLYRTSGGDPIHNIKKHTEWITSAAFSPDGVLMATADRNGGIHVWETFTGREYLKLAGHGKAVTGLSWRTDSNLLATSSEDGTIKLWELENGGQVRSWNAHGGGALSVEFSRDGRLVSTGRDRNVKLWDQAGKQIIAFNGLGEIGTSATFCDETNQLVVGDLLGNAIVVGVDGKEVGRLEIQLPKLASRVAASQAKTAEVKGRLDPAVAGKEAMDKQLATIVQGMESAKQKVVATQAALDAASSKMKTATTTITESKVKEAELVAATDAIGKELPGLQAACKGLGEAYAIRQDPVLKQQLDSTTATLNAKTQALTQSQEALVTTRQTIESATAIITESKKTIEMSQATIVTLNANLKTLGEQNQVLTEKLSAQNQAVATLTAEFTAAKGELDRWIAEEQFVQQLAQNAQQITAAEDKWSTQSAVVAELEEVLAGATTKLESAKQQHAAQVEASKALEAKLAEAMAAQVTTAKQIEASKQTLATLSAAKGKLTSGIEALASAKASAKKALEISGEDPPLADAVKQLETLIATKSEELKTTEAGLLTTQQTLTVQQKSMTDRQAAIEQWKAESETVAKQLVTLTQAVSDAQAMADQHQSKVSEANVLLQNIEAEIESLQEKRLILQGIKKSDEA